MTSSSQHNAAPAVQLVRYGELRPCRTAFIDAHTPGSDQKENFTIIGGGVSESPDQFVHIRQTPGFNIGAAGQPPGCVNSLHLHRTAEVFFVLSGRWRFFWGRRGDAGEVILEEGDIFNIPTGVFRGFENVGHDYGVIMSILGGDDAGGGVVWAPEVIEAAKSHGLQLGEDGRLYDSLKGESLPEGVASMPVLDDASLAGIPEPAAAEVLPRHVARYRDLMALAIDQPAVVIDANGVLPDRPGFRIELLQRESIGPQAYSTERHEVLMVMRGHWRLVCDDAQYVLAPGDTCLIAPGQSRRLAPSMSGEASLYRVRNTDDPAGPTLRVG